MPSERFQRRIDRLLDYAEAAVFQFDWEKVSQCAHAVLTIDPENSYLALRDTLGPNFQGKAETLQCTGWGGRNDPPGG